MERLVNPMKEFCVITEVNCLSAFNTLRSLRI